MVCQASNLTWRRGSDGSVGGYALGYGPLTFLQVLQAGHLVRPRKQTERGMNDPRLAGWLMADARWMGG